MFCPNCGKESEGKFCINCGAPLSADVLKQTEQLSDTPKGKLKACKSCGKPISKAAKICPHCGAKIKHRHPVLGTILAVIGVLFLFSALASGSDNSPQKVSSAGTTPMATEMPSAFTVGDSVSLNDVVVTFVSLNESNGSAYMNPQTGNTFLICEFEIENNSTSDIAISSLMSFEAYVDDYSTNLSISANVVSGKTQLDGTVATGKKMQGVIGYEVPSAWSEFELRVSPSFWGESITFIANKQ